MTDYAYIRVSSHGQTSGDGPERQLGKIQTALGYKLPPVRIFQELGVSGTKELSNREALTRLVSVVQAGDRVWVERGDRLARDTIVSEVLIREFQQLGVSVWSAEGNVDLTKGDQYDPTSKLIRQILGAVSEYEKDSIVIKLRAARARKKAKTGRCEGAIPFGHDPNRPGEVATLESIRAWRIAGETLREIARRLNHRGDVTRKGTPWTAGHLAAICKRLETENAALADQGCI